jgi:hypothetical protein
MCVLSQQRLKGPILLKRAESTRIWDERAQRTGYVDPLLVVSRETGRPAPRA